MVRQKTTRRTMIAASLASLTVLKLTQPLAEIQSRIPHLRVRELEELLEELVGLDGVGGHGAMRRVK